jgi:hypothetical protein
MGSMAIMAAIEISRHEQKMNETTTYWGVMLTKVEEMKWQKFASDRNNCPALNTISHEDRVQILKDFLEFERNKRK